MFSAEDHLTDDIIEQLYFYTHKKISALQQQPIKTNIEAKEVIHNVIYQTLSNETPWNSEKCPNLFVHLAIHVKQTIHHQLNRTDTEYHDNDEINFSEDELQLTFLKFKNLINYLHDHKEALIEDAEIQLLHHEK
ncbi:MAG: hypothetical protein KAG28_06490 [Cocleimonas sp.]|nr:hypothetical protein [Cocleimonas sp.]